MQGLFHAGRCNDDFKLFNEMQTRQLSPDIMTCNILIEGLCRARRTTEALSFLRTMVGKGVSPDIVSYSIVIDGLCKDNKFGMAAYLFNELQSAQRCYL
ncbi:hypothetical protein ACS0TY_000821 [Phlomoides rotata]